MSSLYRRGNVWWVKYRDNDGSIKRESIKTTRKGIAIEAQKVIDRRLRKPISINSADPLELVEAYLEVAKISCGYGHFKNIKSRLNSFIENTRIREPEDITVMKVQDYLTKIATKGGSASTIKGYRTAISTFCEFLSTRHILTENPCRHIKAPKMTRLPPRYLNEAEYEIALKVARDNGIYLEVLTALKTGMRMTEIRFMRWEDIKWEQNLILIPKTKSNRPRSIHLHPELATALKPIAKKSGPVFVGQKGGYVGEKQWRELLRPLQAAIPKFKDGHKGVGAAWHLFRHTFASRYVQAGGDIYRLSKILGHSSVNTTQIYAHLAPVRDKTMEMI